MDLDYEWVADSPNGVEPAKTASAWLSEQLKQSPNDEIQALPPVDYRTLKGKQQLVFLQMEQQEKGNL
ncbi:hypothetical protein R3P38DRAFT_3197471 [Favolaschia claudopus]|uniref:Uncharacterized protein n=1 Tax=Favolaschia claudopus TaxID=2862362 RepID=A0AAW0B4F0_9AGAR